MIKPILCIRKYNDVTVEMLLSLNASGIIVDVDNTIAPHGQNIVTEELVNWINVLKDASISICILTNNPQSRGRFFAEELRVSFVAGIVKPWPWGFRNALKKLGTPKENTIMIGDQVFTDLIGANWAGIRTILVDPISKIELSHTKILRKLEKRLIGERDEK